MNLITAEDALEINTIMDDLWDTASDTVTIVKEAPVSVTDFSGPFVPGFGLSSNSDNFSSQPESGTFRALTAEKQPNSSLNVITTDVEPEQTVSIKFERDGRDYLLDGRKTLYVLLNDKKFNVMGMEEVASIADREYYIFQLKLIQ